MGRRAPEHAPGMRATILLVEAAGDLRALHRGALETGGHIVLAAADGPEGLRIAERHAGPIDLVVTDLIMRGMSGLELMARLRTAQSATKALYMSAYADEKTIAAHDPGAAVLTKPVAIDTLRAKVEEVLGRPRPG